MYYTYITCATYYQIKSAENAKCSPRNDNLNLLVRTKFHWSWFRMAVLIVKTKNVDYQFILYSNKNTNNVFSSKMFYISYALPVGVFSRYDVQHGVGSFPVKY